MFPISCAKYKAIYQFHAENDDELTFSKDDIIVMEKIIDEEWAKGKLLGTQIVGLFPLNFVKAMDVEHDGDFPSNMDSDFDDQITRLTSANNIDAIASPFEQFDNNFLIKDVFILPKPSVMEVIL